MSSLDMLPWQTNLTHQLEELRLIQCSLLPGERFAFVLPQEDLAIWTSLLDAFTDAGGFNADDDENSVIGSLSDPPCQARFEVRIGGVQTWFEVTLARCTEVRVTDAHASPGYASSFRATGTSITVSVKGEHVSRDAHERWDAEISTRIAEMDEGCAFPAYELLTHLTAILHQLQVSSSAHPPSETTSSLPPGRASTSDPPYHALLTSHHLVSPTKRRTMYHLSSQFGITGFAKVGYPGIIYAEGPQEAIETFVREVKGMQWLALRVRFVEPILNPCVNTSLRAGSGSGLADVGTGEQRERWVEVSKVGEVLEFMRMRGREALVTDLGIGAPAKEPKR